jgi:hypothetical protein
MKLEREVAVKICRPGEELNLLENCTLQCRHERPSQQSARAPMALPVSLSVQQRKMSLGPNAGTGGGQHQKT